MNQHAKIGYEWKILILLAMIWGISALDRMAITFLFPQIVPELKLSNAQAGMLTSVLALTYSMSVWSFGSVSDRIGRKLVLVPAAFFFSLMSWLGGVMKSFFPLAVARGLMGIGDGAIYSPGMATIAEESAPERRGLSLGLFICTFPLIGQGLGAIICTQLADSMGWRWTFFIVGIPGMILAVLLLKVMREPPSIIQRKKLIASGQKPAKVPLSEVLKYRNIWLCIIIGSLFLSYVFVFAAFAPLYLTEVHGLDIKKVGYIMSAVGAGGVLGLPIMPWISDHIGRKPILIFSMFAASLGVFAFVYVGNQPVMMFTTIFFTYALAGGCTPLALGTVPSESVPKEVIGTAIGIPTAVGELFGAMAMPTIAGFLGDKYGLTAPLYLAIIAPFVAGFVGFLMIETAPRVLSKKEKRKAL